MRGLRGWRSELGQDLTVSDQHYYLCYGHTQSMDSLQGRCTSPHLECIDGDAGAWYLSGSVCHSQVCDSDLEAQTVSLSAASRLSLAISF